jgi:hypothetical protein
MPTKKMNVPTHVRATMNQLLSGHKCATHSSKDFKEAVQVTRTFVFEACLASQHFWSGCFNAASMLAPLALAQDKPKRSSPIFRPQKVHNREHYVQAQQSGPPNDRGPRNSAHGFEAKKRARLGS